MGLGAIGWYCRPPEHPAPHADHSDADDSVSATRPISSDWAETDGEWLVHCTRVCNGPWPGQTEHQHTDALLLGGSMTTLCNVRSPLDTLHRIIHMQRLVGSAMTTDRSRPVVCFAALPLSELLSRRNYRPHLHRWDYEPYGVAIRKSAAIAAGFQPVIYGSATDRERIRESDLYRFQSVGSTYDWTQEREWRCAGGVDLRQFSRHDVRFFVATEEDAKQIGDTYDVSVVGEYLT